MYVYKHCEFIFVVFATLVNAYFGKIITTDSPKSHNPVKIMHFRKVCQSCCKFLPIMLALYSLLLPPYYAQNYAEIIGSSLSLVRINIRKWIL